jgi:UrcA family protein
MKTMNALYALVAALAAGLANAELNEHETRTTVVHFADLDLASSADMARLHARIRKAAREVCRNTVTRGLLDSPSVRACASRAVEQAVALVDTLALTRLVAGGRIW